MKIVANIVIISLFTHPLLGVYSPISPIPLLKLFYILLIAHLSIKKKLFLLPSPLLILAIWIIGIYSIHSLSFHTEYNTAELYTIYLWIPFALFLSSGDRIRSMNYFKISLFAMPIIFAIVTYLSLNKAYQLSLGNLDRLWTVNGMIIRGSSLNADYNVFAFYFSAVAFISCKLVRKLKYLSNFIFLVVLIALIVIVMTGSRRAAVVFPLFFFVTYFKTLSKSFLVIVPTIYVFRDLILDVVSDKVFLQSWNRILSINESGSFSERTNRWDWAIHESMNRNLFEQLIGSGHHYLKDLGQYIGEVPLDFPHNVLLSCLMYGGLVSLIVMSIWMIFANLYWLRNKDMFLFSSIFFAEVILSLSSHNNVMSSRFLWLLLIIPLLKGGNLIYRKN